MLTQREFQTANKLLLIYECITIKDLSQEFGVSTRTIKYDLENVKAFFAQNGIDFCSKSGKGIWIHCSDNKRIEALNMLCNIEKNTQLFTQEARIENILIQLFLTNDFITSSALADSIKVSRNTILNDLDYIETMLAKNGISLLRKQRFGYKLEGTEFLIRSYFETIIQKKISSIDVYNITQRIEAQSKAALELSLPNGLSKEYSVIEQNFIAAFLKSENNIMGNENLLILLIKTMISVSRIKIGCWISSCEKVANESTKDIVEQSLINIYTQCNLYTNKDEILYVKGKFKTNEDNPNIIELAKDLITQISKSENFSYEQDSTLYSRIIDHLSLSFSDPNSNNFENPFNEAIKKTHFSIFQKVQSVCQIHMPNSPLTTKESFISYIVLHFLVAQKNLLDQNKLTAIFICATGKGAARLINKMIESQIPQIKVLGHFSLAQAEEISAKLKPDIIISVFPISSNIPVVVVNSLPTKENLNAIKRLLKKQNATKKVEQQKQNILDFDFTGTKSEEISQEIIFMGLRIYNKLIEKKQNQIVKELSFALLSHVMLLAHRLYFKKQYLQGRQKLEDTNKYRIIEFEEIFKEIDIEIEKTEIIALLNYFNF